MQGTLPLPQASSEPEAACMQRNQDDGTKHLPAVRLLQLSKANSCRLATLRRTASVASFLSITNVADDQAFGKGPPKKAAYRRRSMVPCQGPLLIRGSSSSTLDSSFSQNATFSRTRSTDSLLANSKGAALKESSATGLSLRRAAAQAAHIKNFTKSIRSSVDSFRDQIRATYESCERARNFLARSDTDQTSVLSPLGTLDDQSLLAKDEFRRRVQESPGVCERSGSLSKSSDSSPVMLRGNSGQLVIKSAHLCQTPSASRCAFHRPQIQTPKLLGDNPNDSANSTSPETETPSTLNCSPADDLPLLDFGSPILRYLPGVGQRIVRTHKRRAMALVANELSVDQDQPDHVFAVSFFRTRSEP